ncbi:MAG: type I pullulanase [Oscillospiraceae bacterium]|nr:type I pullulanase [Oscillospiraceae bacterium]
MKLKRIISVILTVMMLVTVIPVATLNSSAASTPTKYETAAHELDSKYRYDGHDLGATYTPEATTFKVWAPTATECTLNLYATGSDEEEGAENLGTVPMEYDETTGIWATTVDGDQKNVYYTYTVTAKSIATNVVTTKETADVYSVTAGVNGRRSMVCDLDSTDPEGWENDTHVMTPDQSDAIIWEVHVKDFSYAENSGVSKAHRGKFMGFTELGTTLNNAGDIPTCIDYLKDLGVTYVQINPFYDFGSVDEAGADTQFNWGYDPMNYNVPEGSYSTNPYDGNVRVKECKQMIQALHKAGIGVIMDVVYNHTYNTNTSFQACVPDYYYRKTTSDSFSSGSGCGNDTASERAMYRNFMVQSVKYWADEYHIDGFRFDLMGLHDTATMNAIRAELDKISEDMIMYGEGWSMSTTYDLTDCDGNTTKMCTQGSTKNIDPRIGMFNDQFRDGMKGSFSSGEAKGYIQGGMAGSSAAVKYGIRANSSGNWRSYSPAQCVNYVSCHDNNTLYDKLCMSMRGYKKGSTEFRKRDNELIHINKFSETILGVCQGMNFFLAGEEMGRSKDGDENSYSSSATENMIDWNLLQTNQDLVSYYKGMIDIRKAFSPFTTDDVNVGKTQYNIKGALTESTETISFIVDNTVKGEWSKLAVVMNNNRTKSAEVDLPSSIGVTDDTEWVVIANTEEAGLSPIEVVKGKTITVPSSSAMVLVEKTTYDKCDIKSGSSKVKIINKNAETGDVISKQVIYGKIGSKYITNADPSLLLEYTVDSIDGEESGVFGETDKTVVYSYAKYVPSSLKKIITGNTELTIKDVTLIQKYLANKAELTEEQLSIADYDYSGEIDIQDAVLVQKYITHKDIGSIKTFTVKYVNKATGKEIASAKQYKVQAGATDTYQAEPIVGYKYDSYKIGSTTGTEDSVDVFHRFSNDYILFYYTEDNFDVTFHVKHNGSLTWVPTLWAWHDGGNIYSSWPGKKMTKDAEGGWYTETFPVPNGLTYNVIISDNGNNQTKDYTGFDAPELWAVINDSAVTGDSYLTFYTSNPDLA